jgi:hypothetical protein
MQAKQSKRPADKKMSKLNEDNVLDVYKRTDRCEVGTAVGGWFLFQATVSKVVFCQAEGVEMNRAMRKQGIAGQNSDNDHE